MSLRFISFPQTFDAFPNYLLLKRVVTCRCLKRNKVPRLSTEIFSSVLSVVLLRLMYGFSTYSPEADGTDSTFSIPPSKENRYPVVTNKQKVLNFIPVDLFNRFTVKSSEIRVMSPDILSHVAQNKQRYLRLCLTSPLHRLPDTVESTFFD